MSKENQSKNFIDDFGLESVKPKLRDIKIPVPADNSTQTNNGGKQ